MIRTIISDSSLLLKAKLNEYSLEVIENKDEFNYCSFDFETTSLEEIIDCLQTPSFSSENKVVICKNPYFFKDEKMKLPFTNDFKKLEEYIKSPNESTLLIIICPKKYYNSKSKYLTILSKNGSVDNLLMDSVDALNDYAKMLISKTNMEITNDAIELLVARCQDICKLEREIAKLAIYGQHINKDVIKAMVSRPLEDDVFELSNALLKKDHQKTMQIYNDLKLLKIEPIQLISLLANQFRLIMQTSILKKQNKSDAEIATLLNVHPYRIKLSNDYSKKFPLKEVKNIICELSTLDEQIKSGKKDRYIDFEIFLATK